MAIMPQAAAIGVFHSFNSPSAGKALSQEPGLLTAPHAQDFSLPLFWHRSETGFSEPQNTKEVQNALVALLRFLSNR